MDIPQKAQGLHKKKKKGFASGEKVSIKQHTVGRGGGGEDDMTIRIHTQMSNPHLINTLVKFKINWLEYKLAPTK